MAVGRYSICVKEKAFKVGIENFFFNAGARVLRGDFEKQTFSRKITFRQEIVTDEYSKNKCSKRNVIILAMEKKLTPLLTIKSMICRILPMSRTKVKTNKIMKKDIAISLNIYRKIILRIKL